MFTNIFFVILVMLLTIAGGESSPMLFLRPGIAFIDSLIAYIGVLSMIGLQIVGCKKALFRHQEKLLILINIELVAYLLCFYFVFGGYQIFFIIPSAFSNTLATLVVFILYFIGIGAYHVGNELYHLKKSQAFLKAYHELLFLLPFVVPFLLYRLFSDVFNTLIAQGAFRIHSQFVSLATILLTSLFFIATIIVLPKLIVFAWRCRDLKDLRLIEKLEAISRSADFKHAGFKVWTIMQDAINAAIVGILSRFRYIIFTEKLLNTLSLESIEAILAHEIGHSKGKHLLFYPFVFFGMLLTPALFALLIYVPVLQFLDFGAQIDLLALNTGMESIFLFCLIAIIMALYYRIIFGYFSRLFERQADLYVFELGLPGNNMVQALNEISIASGYIHHVPNWHHYSIQQRIDFIHLASDNPTVIKRHHQKTKLSLLIYFLFFVVGLWVLWSQF